MFQTWFVSHKIHIFSITKVYMIKLYRRVEETNNVPNRWFLTAVSRHAEVLQDFVKCDVGQ